MIKTVMEMLNYSVGELLMDNVHRLNSNGHKMENSNFNAYVMMVFT